MELKIKTNVRGLDELKELLEVAKEQTIMKTQTNTNTNTLRSRYVAVTEHEDVELADAHNGKFKRFKKMIAGYGDFVDPRNAGRKMVLDKEFSRKTS